MKHALTLATTVLLGLAVGGALTGVYDQSSEGRLATFDPGTDETRNIRVDPHETNFEKVFLKRSGTHQNVTSDDPWAVYDFDQLRTELDSSGKRYLPFLDRTTLSTGVYSLPAGATDGQQPHGQDELYYVVSGSADFVSGDARQAVKPGSVIFVAAGADHRFVNITERLDLLVFFSKAPVEER